MKFSGGATVIFDSGGRPEMVIYKKLSSKTRRDAQRALAQAGLAAAAPYDVPSGTQARLASIHRGLK